MKTRKLYRSSGLVYGRLWMGGNGAYPAKQLESKIKKNLIKEIEEKISDGSLDSGMGFEYLKGGIFTIETISIITINKKDYKRSDFETIHTGKLTEQEKSFLISTLMNYNF